MDLFLIRHPRPAVTPGTCYGRSDVGLAEPVDAAAQRLRGLLPDGTRVFSSPLQRALLLAKALGTPSIDPRLQEIDFGEWELRPYAGLRAQVDQWAADPLGFRPPGGETATEMASRALAALDDIRGRCGEAPAAIVAHGGPLRAIAGALLGMDALRWFALDFDYGALTHLRIDSSHVSLRCFNR